MNWWLTATFVSVLSAAAGAWWLPPELLIDLGGAAKFGAGFFFAVLAGLSGFLIQRVRWLLDADADAHWRTVELRHQAAAKLKERLTILLVVTGFMCVVCIFLPAVVVRVPEPIGVVMGSVLLGFVTFFLFALVSWAGWYIAVTRKEGEVASQRRLREQRKEQLERLNRNGRGRNDESPQPGQVLTGQMRV